MPNPTFVPNPEDVKMGAAIVVYDNDQLGYTLSASVAMGLTMTTTPVKPDQSAAPITDKVTGFESYVNCTFAAVKPETFAKLPGGDSSGIKDPAGIDLRAIGKELVLYPLDSNDTRVFRFPKATPILNGDITWDPENPQGMPLQFKVYLESAGGYIMKFA